jgi:hypothetical protein
MGLAIGEAKGKSKKGRKKTSAKAEKKEKKTSPSKQRKLQNNATAAASTNVTKLRADLESQKRLLNGKRVCA